MGLAASMGQFLLSAGTPGKRYALPHSRVLMHQGSAGHRRHRRRHRDPGREPRAHQERDDRLIAEHTGQPLETIEHDSLRDRWFTAEEARDYGFVDQVLTDVGAVTPARTARDVRGVAMSSYTIPSVVEKTHRGERAVDIYSRLLTDRIVYLGTEIDDGVANVVIAQLLHLESREPGRRRSTSTSTLPAARSPRCWRSTTPCSSSGPRWARPASARPRSSAAVLLGPAAPGRRTVLPHARVVLHQPSGGGQGTLPDLAVQAKEIVRLRAEMEDDPGAAHRAERRSAARGHRPRPGPDRRAGGRVRDRRRHPGQPEDTAARAVGPA